ncbi:Chaperone protein dnaJ 20, chloroplastic [Linum perenne]
MSQSIILAGTQIVVGRSLTAVTPTFTSNSHSLAFTSHNANFTLLRRSRQPITPIRATADESNNLYVTFYDLLGIPVTATTSEIKQAYRKLARKYHPDVSPPEKLEEHTKHFLRVHEAYETLSDFESRAKYDRDLACGFHFGSPAGMPFTKRKMYPLEKWKIELQLKGLRNKSQMKNQSDDDQSWAEWIRMQRRSSSEFSDDD